jgi:hypothetical protein
LLAFQIAGFPDFQNAGLLACWHFVAQASVQPV